MDIIKLNTEISELFITEKIINERNIRLLISTRDEKHDLKGRVAFIAGKKIGKAHWRNKAKRRMRALCRDLGGPWKGFDVLFIAKYSTSDAPYKRMYDNCLSILTENHVIKENTIK